MDIFMQVITEVLQTLYVNTGTSLIIAVLFMFAYLSIKEVGLKETIKAWSGNFKKNKEYRGVFFLAFYVAMVLCRTLLARSIWVTQPLSKVYGIWGIYTPDGILYTDNIENVILTVPLTFILFMVLQEKMFCKGVKLWTCTWKSCLVSFCFSLLIELCQLFFKLGTFQLSDLFFNTVGGIVGGFIYWICCKIKYKRFKN